MKLKKVKAFAPASVGNAAVGFDIFGFAIEGIGDTVMATKTSQAKAVRILSINGRVTDLPMEPSQNTAGKAALHLLKKFDADFGVDLEIIKGIPMGSGLGGSAASSVAAVMAVGKLFKKSKTKLELLDSAVEGESAATGSRHADNVAPSLFGGLQIVVDNDPLVVTDLPVPSKIYYVVVHPDLKIETKTARGILKPEISLKQFIKQSALIAGFTKACCKGDMNLLRLTLKDTVIEPQRAHLIPGFSQAKQACADLGAIGFSISGAGPSVFAWADSKAKAAKIGSSIKKIFEDNQMLASVFVGRISKKGAYIKTK